MELSIQERLKDLRVERGLTLEQLHNGCAHNIHNGICALYLLDCRSVHIDFKVSHQPGEVRVRRQLTQEGIIHQPTFQ